MSSHRFAALLNTIKCLNNKTESLGERGPSIPITIIRWGTLLLYAWLAVLVVYPVLPWLSYIRPGQWLPLIAHPYLYDGLLLTYALIAAMLVIYLQSTFYLRLPRKRLSDGTRIQVMGFMRYPTLHVSVILGIWTLFYWDGLAEPQYTVNMEVTLSDRLKLLILGPTSDIKANRMLYACGLWAVLIFYMLIQVIRQRIAQSSNGTDSNLETNIVDLAACVPTDFKAWLTSEKSTNGRIDFLDRTPYVERICQRLQVTEQALSEDKGQIILGDFGSGKTSLIEMVEKKLPDAWIVSYFDCWQRSAKPEELATQFMEQIIHDVGQQIEVTSLSRLPESFSQALYGSHHVFGILDAFLRPLNPGVVIEKLNDILKSNGRRLLIVIENIDRNQDNELFIDVMGSILDKLRLSNNSQCIKFIFSGSEQSLSSELIYRIADYKEDLDTSVPPEVILRFMAFCLEETFSKNGESIIIPYLPQGFSLQHLSQVPDKIKKVEAEFYMRPHAPDSLKSRVSGEPVERQVLEALADVLSNPRTLKFVLRETYHLWNDFFKGEIHLFDLILYITSQQDGALKDRLKNYPEDALAGSQDSPYVDPMRDKLRKKADARRNHESSQPDLIVRYQDAGGNKRSVSVECQTKPAVVDITHESSSESSTSNRSRETLAHYMLNGYLAPGHSSREVLVQPFVGNGGNDDGIYRKYRVILKRKFMGEDDFHDQFFIRNYIDSCGLKYEKQSITNVMDCWLKNPPIAYSLTEAMTLYYFQSEKQVIQFLRRALLVFDQKYVHGYGNFIISDLMAICIKATEGDAKNLQALVGQVIASFKGIYKASEYQWGVRVLFKMVIGLNTNSYFNKVVDPIVSSLIRPDVAQDFANQYLAKNDGCQHLSDHFFLLVETIVSEKPHDSYFSEPTMRQCAQTFIQFMALVCEKEADAVRIILTRINRTDSRFLQFHDHLSSYLELGDLTEAEKQVLEAFKSS